MAISIEKTVSYYKNGKIKFEEYRSDNKHHREDRPAVIRYYENGNIEYEEHRLNGNLHREDGPAFIWYYENGKVQFEEYWLNGIFQKKVEAALKEWGNGDENN